MWFSALSTSVMAIILWRLSCGKALPSISFCAAWAFVYSLQTLLAPDMLSSMFATTVVLTLLASYGLGNMFGSLLVERWGNPRRKMVERTLILNRKTEARLGQLTMTMSILSLVGAIHYSDTLGVMRAGSFNEFILMAGTLRTEIFSEVIQLELIDKVGLPLSYSAVIISIMYWYLFGWKWRLILSSLAVVIIGVSQSGRAGTFIIILQWMAAVGLKRFLDPQYRVRKILWLSPVLILLVFILMQLLREGFYDVSGSSIKRTLYMMRNYMFGGVSAFAYYCDHLWGYTELSLGKYTFSSLYSALGLGKQASGIYDSYVQIAPAGDITNIYTAFRSFIDDYTFGGSIIIFIVLGILSGIFYARLYYGNVLMIAILVPIFSFLLFSPFASLTYFNSFLMSLVFPYWACKWCVQLRHSRRRFTVVGVGACPVRPRRRLLALENNRSTTDLMQ